MTQIIIDSPSNASETTLTASPTLTSEKKLKVLLYGNIQGAQLRSQILIKYLLDSRYSISFVCPNFYVRNGMPISSFFRKILTRIHLIELFIKSFFADVIYILPLNISLIENAVLVSKLFRKKLISENHVSLYDTILEERDVYKGGIQKENLEMRRDKLALTKPDYIINTSNHEPAYWAKKLGIELDNSKVFVAPIFSGSTLTLKRNFMEDGVLKICWWGTFIPLHGLDNILQAVKILKARNVQFRCNFFGIDNPSFKAYAKKIQLDELDSHVSLRKDLTFFDGSLPQYIIKNCDLALGIFGNTSKASNCFPTKLVESLSMGIPTLTMSSPALTEFLDLNTDLWTCEPSPVSIAEMITEIVDGTVPAVNWEQTRQKVMNSFSISQYQMVVSKILCKVANDLSKES